MKRFNQVCGLFLISIVSFLPGNSLAKPIDDFFANAESRIKGTSSGGTQSAISQAEEKSQITFGKSRKLRLIPKSAGANVEGIIPKYSAESGSVEKVNPLDVNRDGIVSPLDALIIVNHLNSKVRTYKAELDVNTDKVISPLDILLVINCLNKGGACRDGSGAAPAVVYKPAVILLTDKDGSGNLEVVFDGDQSDANVIRYDGLKVNLVSGGADGFIVPFYYASINDKSSGALLKIDMYSGSKDKVSTCNIPLPATNTINGVTRALGELEVKFKDCTGSADLTKIGAVVLTLNGESRGGLDLRILGFKTNGGTISSPEDISLASDIASPPVCSGPCGCDANFVPLPSGPCGCDTSVINEGCGCGLGPKDACGNCPNDPNKILDKGCGCGFDGPDPCDRCPPGSPNPKASADYGKACECKDPCGCLPGTNTPSGIINQGCGCGNPPPSGCDNVCGSTKIDQGCGCGLPPKGECGCDGAKKDECGFCPDDPNKRVNLGCGCGNGAKDQYGCCSNNPAGCDAVCGSNKVPDKCGVCGGNGSSCEECLFVAGWTDVSGFQGQSDKYNDHSDILAKLNIERTQPLPSCLSDKIKASGNCECGEGRPNDPRVCGPFNGGVVQDASVKIWGYCLFGGFKNIADYYFYCAMMGNKNSETCNKIIQREQDAFANALGVPPNLRDQFVLPPVAGNAQSGDAPYWFFDKNCNFIASPGDKKVCGYAGVSWSPISLILDDSVDLNQEMKVVEFNLAGNNGPGFVLWKGSSSAPLLVYDPENSKNVASAKQLFGNFAFGGQTGDINDFKKEGYRKPWKNGYEALSLLDKNADDKLSGDELSSLGLWFDKNRNGKSEDGEIKTLQEEKILALYYTGAEQLGDSRDVKIEIGFEKEVNGEVVKGKSIDWFTETFESKAEALSALSGLFKSKSGDRPMLQDNNEFENLVTGGYSSHASSPKGITFDHPNNITGYWIWTILEKGADKNPGVFVLSENTEGDLQGFSISEAILGNNKAGMRSAMVAVPGTGKINRTYGEDGVIKITFKDKNSGGVSVAEGTLSEDGTIITGNSIQSYELKIDGKVRSASVNYKWIATKTGIKHQ